MAPMGQATEITPLKASVTKSEHNKGGAAGAIRTLAIAGTALMVVAAAASFGPSALSALGHANKGLTGVPDCVQPCLAQNSSYVKAVVDKDCEKLATYEHEECVTTHCSEDEQTKIDETITTMCSPTSSWSQARLGSWATNREKYDVPDCAKTCVDADPQLKQAILKQDCKKLEGYEHSTCITQACPETEQNYIIEEINNMCYTAPTPDSGDAPSTPAQARLGSWATNREKYDVPDCAKTCVDADPQLKQAILKQDCKKLEGYEHSTCITQACPETEQNYIIEEINNMCYTAPTPDTGGN